MTFALLSLCMVAGCSASSEPTVEGPNASGADTAELSTIVPSETSDLDDEWFGEVLGVRVEIPKHWQEDTSAEADDWRYSAIGTDGEIRLRCFDNLDRTPYVETGGTTTSPGSLREAADVLVINFPDEFGATPELTDIVLDGTPAVRIGPTAPANNDSDLETIFTTGSEPSECRYLEMRGTPKVLSDMTSTFRRVAS